MSVEFVAETVLQKANVIVMETFSMSVEYVEETVSLMVLVIVMETF